MPAFPATAKLEVIEDAPGSYVKDHRGARCKTAELPRQLMGTSAAVQDPSSRQTEHHIHVLQRLPA